MPKNYERDENDAYFTPAWCVDQCINEVLPNTSIVDRDISRILDPGAGKGVFGDRLRALCADYTINITAVELNPNFHGKGYYNEYNKAFIGDFLQCKQEQLGGHFDFAIGNPPYKLAVEFVQHCISMCEWTIMFLRQGFLSSMRRSVWLKEHQPASVHILPNRPSFTGGTSDKSDYCWVVWNHVPWQKTILYWLDPVPSSIRRPK